MLATFFCGWGVGSRLRCLLVALCGGRYRYIGTKVVVGIYLCRLSAPARLLYYINTMLVNSIVIIWLYDLFDITSIDAI